MDQWLNDAPALAYVKELYIWVVLNNNGNLIAWTGDAAETDELSLWVWAMRKSRRWISQLHRTPAVAS